MMLKILQSIKGLIKLAQLSTNLNVRYITTQYHSKQQNALHFIPYGMQISPPATKDIAVLVLNKEGQEEAYIGMVSDINNRNVSLSTKEVAIGIPTGTTFIHFLANGNIEFILNGTAGSAGTPDYLVKYNELLTAFNSLKSTFNTHTHAVTTAPGTTATPLPQSTADMTSAKLGIIEVPNV